MPSFMFMLINSSSLCPGLQEISQCVTATDHFLPKAGYHREGDSTGISDEE